MYGWIWRQPHPIVRLLPHESPTTCNCTWSDLILPPSQSLQVFLRVPYLVLFSLPCMSTIFLMLVNSVKLQCSLMTQNCFQPSKLRTTANTYKMTWITCEFGRQKLASRSTTRSAKPRHITRKFTPLIGRRMSIQKMQFRCTRRETT